MADSVTSQIIDNGQKWIVLHLTGVSDGTGETLVKKLDAAAGTYAVSIAGQSFPPGIHLKVREINYDVAGERVELFWDATTPQALITLGGWGNRQFDKVGGLPCPRGLTGATGSILLSTINAALGSTYSITLRCIKGVPQA